MVNNLFLKLLINFKAGISSGYVMKPCLDPFDPECPNTAPNYKTKKVIIPVLFKEPVKHVYHKGMTILAINRMGVEKPCTGLNCAGGAGILWNLRDEIVGSGIPKILLKFRKGMLFSKLSCRKISNTEGNQSFKRKLFELGIK